MLRSDTAGGPYARIARVTTASYADLDVVEERTYFYVVRSVDTSLNRSALSAEVSATAERRLVTVVFDVTVPATTDGTGRTVHVAGTLDRLEPPGPAWNPAGVALTRVDATRWTVTLQGREGTQLEYKYALGAWEYVECRARGTGRAGRLRGRRNGWLPACPRTRPAGSRTDSPS